jgi:sec-independent protein translocase protein TatC
MGDDERDQPMSFMEHLGELRRRIMWSVLAVGIGFGITFPFSQYIIKFLARPVPVKLAFMAPTEAFWVNMKVAMIGGLALAMPVVLLQVWLFVAPGLHRQERRFALPFIVVGSLFFAIGVTFALMVVVPFAINFLLTYKTEDLTPVISIGSYTDFVLKFALAFGVVFQMPLAITLGTRMGLVTPEFLARNRKYAILVNFIIAAILTPTPDVFNQTLMAGPLILLYEVGIIAARVVRRRARAAAAERAS